MAKAKPYKNAKLMRLYYVQQRKSIEDIAKEFNVSTNTIRTALKEHGLK